MVELIVYSVLLIIILGIAASLLIQTMVVQRDIRAMADASNTAQLTFRELERDLRNASMVQIMDNGALLLMHTRAAHDGNDDYVQCVGYHLDPATGELRRTSSTDATLTSAAASAGGGSALSTVTESWGVARDGISASPSHRAFGPNDDAYSVHDSVEIHLSAATIDDRPPVVFEKSITLRLQGGLSGSCT